MGRLRTLTSNKLLYNYATASKVTSPQMLGLQGLCPRSADLSCVSDPALREMVGEGMFAPSIALALSAYFANLHGPWWSTESKKVRSIPEAGETSKAARLLKGQSLVGRMDALYWPPRESSGRKSKPLWLRSPSPLSTPP